MMTQRRFSRLVGAVTSSVYDHVEVVIGKNRLSALEDYGITTLEELKYCVDFYFLFVYLYWGLINPSKKSFRWVMPYMIKRWAFCNRKPIKKNKVSYGVRRMSDRVLAVVVENAPVEDTFRFLEDITLNSLYNRWFAYASLAQTGAFHKVVPLVEKKLRHELVMLSRRTRCSYLCRAEKLVDALSMTAPFAPDECSLEKIADRCRWYLAEVFYLLPSALYLSHFYSSLSLGLATRYAAGLLGFESLEVVLSLLEASPEKRYRFFERHCKKSGRVMHSHGRPMGVDEEGWKKLIDSIFTRYLIGFLCVLVSRVLWCARWQKRYRYVIPLEIQESSLSQSDYYKLFSFDMEKFPKKEEEMHWEDIEYYMDIMRRLLKVCDAFDNSGWLKGQVLDLVAVDLDGRWAGEDFSYGSGVHQTALGFPEYREFIKEEVFPVLKRWMMEGRVRVQKGILWSVEMHMEDFMEILPSEFREFATYIVQVGRGSHSYRIRSLAKKVEDSLGKYGL